MSMYSAILFSCLILTILCAPPVAAHACILVYAVPNLVNWHNFDAVHGIAKFALY